MSDAVFLAILIYKLFVLVRGELYLPALDPKQRKGLETRNFAFGLGPLDLFFGFIEILFGKARRFGNLDALIIIQIKLAGGFVFVAALIVVVVFFILADGYNLALGILPIQFDGCSDSRRRIVAKDCVLFLFGFCLFGR